MSSSGGRRADALASAQWDGKTLVVDDPKALKKIRRKEISPSTVSNIQKCPASFAASSVLPQESDPFQPRIIGTGAHEAMEHLFQQAPDDRTPEFVHAEVDRIRDALWSEDDLAVRDRRTLLLPDAPEEFHAGSDITDELVEANQASARRWDGIVRPWTQGIFALNGQPHPREVNVFATELAVGGWDYENQRENPTKLKLQGLQGEFPVQGKVDRTDVVLDDRGQQGLFVDDYKFPGKKPRKLNQQGDYADQQRAYRLFIEALFPGQRVVGASLLYPGWNQTAFIDVSEGAMRSTLMKFENAWLTMNRSADAGRFDTKPSNLCGWCDLANACPVARITTEKAAGSAATKPSGASLGLSIARPHTRPSAWAQQSDYAALPGYGLITNGQPTSDAAPAATAPASGAAHSEPHAVHRERQNHNDFGGDPLMNQPAAAPLTSQYPTSEYAAIATFGLTDAAVDLLVRQGADLTPSTISNMAGLLANAVEDVTRSLFGDLFDWGHGRAGRITYALRETIKVRPAPFTVPMRNEENEVVAFRPGTREEWDAWYQRIVGLTRAKAEVAIGLTSGRTVPAASAIEFFGGRVEQNLPHLQSVDAVA